MKNGSMGGLHLLFEWLAKLAYLNILWLIFSLAGLVILGVGPATISVFTIVRNMLRENEYGSIWRQFYQTYRTEFWHANRLMIIVYVVFAFLYIDYTIIQTLPYSFLIDKVVFPALLLLTMLAILGASYLFAVYVHFELAFWMNIKYALVMIGLYPLSTVMMIVGLFIFSIILSIFPAIVPFYIISAPALIIFMCANRAFDKFVQAKAYHSQKHSHES
ncbi:YesL family protein [Gracilibacillus lacisalsi]|uniref:YesL family protein n=1 Tax=Gracilibacillus lacisalsi TaxID=393087 RepID=UPI000369EB28|nr:DUF624 domain-containing protein [Gracilibacillus lacisalsi]